MLDNKAVAMKKDDYNDHGNDDEKDENDIDGLAGMGSGWTRACITPTKTVVTT